MTCLLQKPFSKRRVPVVKAWNESDLIQFPLCALWNCNCRFKFYSYKYTNLSAHCPIAYIVRRPLVEQWPCQTVGFCSMALWVWTPNLSNGAIPPGLHRSLIFSNPVGVEISWQLCLRHPTAFIDWFNWVNIGHSVSSLKSILTNLCLPRTCWH